MRRSSLPCIVFAVLFVGACGGGSSQAAGSGSTVSAARSSSVVESSSRTATSTTFAVPPRELPRFVVLSLEHSSVPPSQTLEALDRRSGRRIELAGPSRPPPPFVGGDWTLNGFDVSPDGRSVAFGVVSQSSATPTAGIYLEPIDGSSVARRARVINGAAPYVWIERFSPDGRWLIGAAKTWTVWPVGSGAPIVSDISSPYPAQGIQWSPDGTRIAFGEYYEGCCGSTSILRFDAAHRTLTSAGVDHTSQTIPGTRPWFSSDGVLHVVRDPTLLCTNPDDVDSSFRWGLSAPSPGCSGVVTDLAWWRAADGPQRTAPLHLVLPDGVRQVAW